MLSEKLGKANFWLMVIGMNLTFGPMHILGLQGQPRRMYVYGPSRAGEGFFNIRFWNLSPSIGSFILAIGMLLFLINVVVTTRKGVKAPLDPWDARSLEWMTASPPKEHNFDVDPDRARARRVLPPQVRRRRRRTTARVRARSPRPRSCSPSRRPTPTRTSTCRRRRTGRSSLAFALPIMAYGIIFSRWLIAVGWRSSLLLGVFGWALEPSDRRRPRLRPAGPRRRTGGELARWSSRLARPRRRSTPPTTRRHGGDDTTITPSHHTTTGLSNNKLAMWLFLGSECLLFGGLISTYMLYRGRHTQNLGPDQVWDIPFTSVVELRAADVVADDGARRLRRPARATTATRRCG